jgi:hypothetical protein
MKKNAADVQIALRLPRELHDKLKATGNVSDAIRRRLEGSSSDPITAAFLSEVAEAAEMLARHWVPWHQDAAAYAVFRDAVIALLDQWQTNKTGAPKSHQAEVLFGGDDAGERLALMVGFKAL